MDQTIDIWVDSAEFGEIYLHTGYVRVGIIVEGVDED